MDVGTDGLAGRLRGAPTVHVEWCGTRVRVATHDEAVATHLSDQFHTTADVAVPPAAASPNDVVDVGAVADPACHAALRALPAAGEAGWRESFDGWWYRCWTTRDDVTVLASDRGHAHAHVMVTEDFRSWTVAADDADELKTVLTRTIRELVREELVGRDGVMAHAAAAVLPGDGAGVAFVGGAGAGKTSAAVVVSSAGGWCVATDRTVLLPLVDGWQAVGLPTSTRLGRGSVTALNRIARTRGLPPLPLPERAAGPQFGKEPKLSLSNREVAETLGGGFRCAAPLDLVVVLSPGRVARPEVARLRGDDATAALREHVLVPDDAYRSRWLSPDPRPETDAGLSGRLDDLVERTPVVGVVWDPARHCEPGLVEWLASLRSSGQPASGQPVSRTTGAAGGPSASNSPKRS